MWCTRYTTGLLCREGEPVGSVVLYGNYLYQSAYRHGVIPEAWKLARGKIDYRPAQKNIILSRSEPHMIDFAANFPIDNLNPFQRTDLVGNSVWSLRMLCW